MPRTQPFLIAILLVLSLQHFTYVSYADVGTAAWCTPPYLPTTCYGADQTQFPSSNWFGTARNGIWDYGASCGRQYFVRFISPTKPKTCLPGLTIRIKIVEYALQPASPPSGSGTTIVSSQTAFAAITNSSSGEGRDCIGLRKTLVYDRGSAGKGTKTDWIMHEYRFPPNDNSTASNAKTTLQEAEGWTICRIFKRNVPYRKLTPDWKESSSSAKRHSTLMESTSKPYALDSNNHQESYISFEAPIFHQTNKPMKPLMIDDHLNEIRNQQDGESTHLRHLAHLIISRKRTPFIVGGSNSYSDALLVEEELKGYPAQNYASAAQQILRPSVENQGTLWAMGTTMAPALYYCRIASSSPFCEFEVYTVRIEVDSLIVLDLNGGFGNKGFKSVPIGFYPKGEHTVFQNIKYMKCSKGGRAENIRPGRISRGRSRRNKDDEEDGEDNRRPSDSNSLSLILLIVLLLMLLLIVLSLILWLMS